MIIGIPKEVKHYEYRVGATPAMVRELVDAGHTVRVETNAGSAIGFYDDNYQSVGAEIAPSAKDVWQSEMIIKVKEPQADEFPLMHEGQILFCYLHLAPDPEQTQALIDKKVVAIAYETVTDKQGRLPLLVPMSEMAGRISIQAGAVSLQLNHGGKGLLLGGVPGVSAANVYIIGGGVVGTEAARMALGLGANVTILDKNLSRLRELDALFGPRLKTLYSSASTMDEILPQADLVVGAVLIPGKKAPKLVTKDDLNKMTAGSVIVDVAIDQGGCFETSRPTTHGDPRYVVNDVIHYCVTNMPGACARTSTIALTNATFSYVLEIANKGYQQALKDDHGLMDGLNVCYGYVTNGPVASDLGYTYTPAKDLVQQL